jgi:hypothetical protein
MSLDHDVVRGPLDHNEALGHRRMLRSSHDSRGSAEAESYQGDEEQQGCDAAIPGHVDSCVSRNKRAASAALELSHRRDSLEFQLKMQYLEGHSLHGVGHASADIRVLTESA